MKIVEMKLNDEVMYCEECANDLDDTEEDEEEDED